ncbi:MAG: HlyD family secretion protein [Gammaproteobacteria bacterium]
MTMPFDRTIRALAADGPRAAHGWWLVAGLVVVAWGAWFVLAEITLYETTAQARVEVASAAHPVAAAVDGRVVASRLELGARVAAGSVLLELDDRAERLHLAEAEAELAALPATRAALAAELAAQEAALAGTRDALDDDRAAMAARLREARASADYASARHTRLAQLAADHRVAEIDVLAARAEADKAAALVAAVAAETARNAADGATRRDSRRATIEALRRETAELDGRAAVLDATVARLEAELERYRVRAPVAGVLGEVAAVEAGSVVAAGALLAQVVPAGELAIVASMSPAAVLGRVKPGQPARLRLDGFPWAQYGAVEATVARVASEVRDGSVRVELEPRFATGPHPPLQHGLPGTLEIAIERTTPARLLLRLAGQRVARPTQATTVALAP